MKTVCQHVCQHVFGHCRWGNENQFLATCYLHSFFRKCGLCGSKRVFSKMAQCINLCKEKEIARDTVTSSDKEESVEMTSTVEFSDGAQQIDVCTQTLRDAREISGSQIVKDFFRPPKIRVRRSDASDVNNTVGGEATSLKEHLSCPLSVSRVPKMARKSSSKASNVSTSPVLDEREAVGFSGITEVPFNHGNLLTNENEAIIKLHTTRKAEEKQRLCKMLTSIDKMESAKLKPSRGITEDRSIDSAISSNYYRQEIHVSTKDVNRTTVDSIVLLPSSVADPSDSFPTGVTDMESSTMDDSEYDYIMRAESTQRLGDTFARIAMAKRQQRKNRAVKSHRREVMDQYSDNRTTEANLDHSPTISGMLSDSTDLPPSSVTDYESTGGFSADITADTARASSTMDDSEYDYIMRAESTQRLGDTFARIAMAKRQQRKNRNVKSHRREVMDQYSDIRTSEENLDHSPTVSGMLSDSTDLPPSSVTDYESTGGFSVDVTDGFSADITEDTARASSTMDESEYEYIMRAESTRRLGDTFARIAMAKRRNRKNRTVTRCHRRENVD